MLRTRGLIRASIFGAQCSLNLVRLLSGLQQHDAAEPHKRTCSSTAAPLLFLSCMLAACYGALLPLDPIDHGWLCSTCSTDTTEDSSRSGAVVHCLRPTNNQKRTPTGVGDTTHLTRMKRARWIGCRKISSGVRLASQAGGTTDTGEQQ